MQKVTAEIAMNVKRISEKIGNSETNADNLLNAMRTVQHSSQQIETLTNKVGVIERQIKDSGLGKGLQLVMIMSLKLIVSIPNSGREAKSKGSEDIALYWSSKLHKS